MRDLRVMVVAAAFAAGGGAALAVSAIPDTSGVFHGCVSPRSGALRVVKAASACRKAVRRHGKVVRAAERAIAWNKTGPAGAAGQPGAQGAQGAQGEKGAQGDRGPAGATFVAAAHEFASDPAATPDETVASAHSNFQEYTFTLPAAGTVLLRYFSPGSAVTCSSGAGEAGIYLDGAPVAKSAHGLGTSADINEWVGTVGAAAGAHTVDLLRNCPSGTITSFTQAPNADWTVVLAG